MEGTYIGGSWVELVDAGHQNDAELCAAWVPERIERDFHAASFYRKDLASALLGGAVVPAAARALRGCEEDVLGQMAAHLAGLGFDVLAEPADRGGGAAAEAGRRVRYTTCAALVNELAEAADERTLSRVVARYGRLDLLCWDLCRHRNYAEHRGARRGG